MDNNTTKTIIIACAGSGSMPVAEFQEMQGDLKTISKENLDKLKKRIVKYGFDAPIYVWGQYILDGHQRLSAIMSLISDGYTVDNDMLPICEIKAKNKSDAKKRLLGYISQYGKITKAGFDNFTSDLELDEITLEIDIPSLDLDHYVDESGNEINDAEPQIDKANELLQKWLVNVGDIWQCGDHRIICGDCTDPSVIDALMDGKQAQIAVTDPPYNVSYIGKTKDNLVIDNDKMSGAEFLLFLLTAFTNMAHGMEDGCPFYVFHADIEVINFRTALQDAGFLVKQGLVWNKSSMVMGRSDYHWKHEPILYGWKDGAEIAPKYVSVVLQRYLDLTGTEPIKLNEN